MSNYSMKKNLKVVFIVAICVLVGLTIINTNQVYAITKIKKATITAAKAIDANTAKIKWKRVNNAKKYQLFASVDGGQYKKVITTKKLQYTHKKLKAGKKYSYKVRAIRGNKRGAFSRVKRVKLPLYTLKFSGPQTVTEFDEDGLLRAGKITAVKIGSISSNYSILKISGMKTYERFTDLNCPFFCKIVLYKNGNKKYSADYMSPSLYIGQSFSNSSCIFNHIAPGAYIVKAMSK